MKFDLYNTKIIINDFIPTTLCTSVRIPANMIGINLFADVQTTNEYGVWDIDFRLLNNDELYFVSSKDGEILKYGPLSHISCRVEHMMATTFDINIFEYCSNKPFRIDITSTIHFDKDLRTAISEAKYYVLE